MKIIDINTYEPVLNTGEIIGKKFYTRDELEAVQITIKPGGHLKSHKTPVDVLFLVIKGTAELDIGDDTIRLERLQSIESPKNIPHAVRNPGDEDMEILVLKTPKP
ncbi:MAG TPA: cupin domain-containing protein [Thermotogota bacterium]|nr:cupin domain-containing protein [Thermotogota bacterium]HRW34702.1 cupin domain-containing protein [Thermotogota bacterium]